MEKKWDVYVYGDVNIDLVIPNVRQVPAPGEEEEVPLMETFVGGGAALFAMGVAKLGLRPVFQGSVGGDLYGGYIRSSFCGLGIDDSLLATDSSGRTGISISFTDEKDRSFLTYRGTNADISIEKLSLDQAAMARHIHVTGYAGRSNHREYRQVLTQLRSLPGVTVSFDVGWDCTGEWYEGIYELLPFIDILFMNETESLHYARKATAKEAALSLATTANTVVIKLGSKGSLAVRGGTLYEAPGYRVRAVDSTGAGDSFNAGFVYAFLKQKPIEECLVCANACGALSVTKTGGNSGFPTEPELVAFINSNRRTKA